MKFFIIDAYYPDAICHFDEHIGWQPQRLTRSQWLSRECFHGTADYWETALAALGHEAVTHVFEDGPKADKNLDLAIRYHKPDVICSQNVGRFNATRLQEFHSTAKLVGFCSYAADVKNLIGFDVVFSSFPWLVENLNKNGQRAVYMPLAFGKSVLEHVTQPGKDLPLTFVGGAGGSIWTSGTALLNRVAETFQDFEWYGYRNPPVPHALERAYRGPAWGLEYFLTLARSRITINRHGEVAGNLANNMRLFEAPGMRTCMLTENFPNVANFYVPGVECMTYDDPGELIFKISMLLADTALASSIAAAGQARTLKDHCYENRVDKLLEAIA